MFKRYGWFFLIIVLLVFSFELSVASATQLTCSNGSASPGNSDTISISIDDASGLSSFYLILSFDTTKLDVESVSLPSLTSGFAWDTGFPAIDETTGQARLSASGSAISSGSGSIVEITFEVEPGASGSSTLSITIEDIVINGSSVSADVVNGLFSTTSLPCQSAVAEIDPLSVNVNVISQQLTYYIEPIIGASDDGIDEIKITVPSTYSNISLIAVTVGGSNLSGSGVDYASSVSNNVITVTLTSANKITTDGTDIRIFFAADTPTAVDSGTDFTSTLDNTSVSEPINCAYGDGDGGGSVTTNSWTVVAGYAGPCTSALAEINPTQANINVTGQTFTYYINPTISSGDSGIDEIQIEVPSTYSNITLSSVKVGGSALTGGGVDYNSNVTSNVITITLTSANKISTSGTQIEVAFTADTPTATDSGTDFPSTLDDMNYPDPVFCTSGDGDGGGSVTTNTWTVTAAQPSGDGGGGGGCFIATAAFGSPMESHVSILRDFRDTYLLSFKLGRIFINIYNRYSPTVAHFIAKHETLKSAVRISLLPIVAISYSILHFGMTITVIILVFIFLLPVFFASFYRRKLKGP